MPYTTTYLQPGNVGAGLLGSPSSYAYPLTSGLMGAISQPGAMQGITNSLTMPSNSPDYTQTARALAGNPHAGPYANTLGAVPTGGAIPNIPAQTAGGTSGGSTLSQIAGGLLGLLGGSKSNSGQANGVAGLLKGLLGSGSTGSNQQQINNFLSDLNSSGALNGNNFTNLDLGNDSSILGNYGSYNPYGSNSFMTNGDSNLMNTDFSSGSLFGNSFDQNLLDQYNDNPSGAGGQAATVSNMQTTSTTPAFDAYQATNSSSTSPSLGGLLGGANNALGIFSGLSKGGLSGYGSAALNSASLAGKAGMLPSGSAPYVNDAGNLLGIYTGLKNGGVMGDTQAAVDATKLAAQNGAFGDASSTIGNYANYAAIPLSLYNFANNYQSGATGTDTLNGTSAGATIGGAVGGAPGAIVGGAIGAAAGALSSAFGPGAKDAETYGFQNLINATSSNGNAAQIAASVSNPYVMMAGLFDEHSSTLPIYSKYGRRGEQQFSQDLMTQINDAYSKGTIGKSSTPQDVYNKVVAPWVNGMGDWSKVGDTYKAATSGLLQNMVSQYMDGTFRQNWTNKNGQVDLSTQFAPGYGGTAWYSGAQGLGTPGAFIGSQLPGGHGGHLLR